MGKMSKKLRVSAQKKNSGSPYSVTKKGTWWQKPSRQGDEYILLSNFGARICSDITKDDGARKEHFYEVEVKTGTMTERVLVEASKFLGLQWISEQIGAAAIIEPGYQIRDRLRAAIQFISLPIRERLVYSHLGWRKFEGTWWYLHAGGLVGAPDAATPDVQLDCGGFESYVLPKPPGPAKLRSAIRASLSILDVAPAFISYALLAAIYRAPLSEALPVDFSLFFVGPSGSQKSELTALAQAHFGKGFNRLNLPANWTGTPNALVHRPNSSL